MMTWFFTILTFIVICLSLTNSWFLSQGKLKVSYPLIIAICSLCIIIETTLALRDPTQIGILMFDITNTWSIIMATKGLARIKEEEKDKLLSKEK